ncbi:hypothetical protein ACOMHN_020049 [Nucella lapillus]
MTNQDENKEAFYQQLDEVVCRVPADEKLIILGDLNARISSNHTTWEGIIDIDECQENTHGCQHQCVNTESSYQCSCFSGFTLNTTDLHTCARESDVNECDLNQCSQKCNNTYGSYACSCYAGFQLDADKVTCKVCDRNHWGENCNMTCNCDPLGSQHCDRETGCVCHSGWRGVRCDEDLHECLGDPCTNLSNSQCIDTVGSFRCQCRDGYMMNAARNACVARQDS